MVYPGVAYNWLGNKEVAGGTGRSHRTEGVLSVS